MRRVMTAGVIALAAGVAAGMAAAQDDHGHDAERRELGAHVHGEGALSIAIDGGEVAMELEAPGADIVGFEHPAATEEDRAAIEAAEAKLGDPLSLFILPSAAECSVREASVELHGEPAHDAHEGEAHVEHEKAQGEDHTEAASHTEFHAEYLLDCASPELLDRIEFAYFESFPNAERLDVALVSDHGQSAREVTREDAVLAVGGGS